MKQLKSILLAGTLFTTIVTVNAQIAETEVIATAGGSANIGGTSIDWTIGELVTETVSTESFILTQGFHQGEVLEIITSLDIEQVKVTVFPNPTASQLQVELNDFTDVEFHLFDIKGDQVLFQSKPTHTRSTIDVSSYPSGIYMLEIFDLKANSKEIVKIIKN